MQPNSISGSNEDCNKIPIVFLDHSECHGHVAEVTDAPDMIIAFNMMTMSIQRDQSLSLAEFVHKIFGDNSMMQVIK